MTLKTILTSITDRNRTIYKVFDGRFTAHGKVSELIQLIEYAEPLIPKSVYGGFWEFNNGWIENTTHDGKEQYYTFVKPNCEPGELVPK